MSYTFLTSKFSFLIPARQLTQHHLFPSSVYVMQISYIEKMAIVLFTTSIIIFIIYIYICSVYALQMKLVTSIVSVSDAKGFNWWRSKINMLCFKLFQSCIVVCMYECINVCFYVCRTCRYVYINQSAANWHSNDINYVNMKSNSLMIRKLQTLSADVFNKRRHILNWSTGPRLSLLY